MATIGQQILTPETGWKRITETEILNNSTHDGSWTVVEHSSYYNGKFLKCSADSNELTFYIKSKSFRFISSGGVSRASDCTILINDVVYDANLKDTTGYVCLLFEKTGLNDVNKIVLRSGTNGTYKFVLDCIDIDEDGELVALPTGVGSQLLTPEVGWKRIDDSDSNIKYIGTDWQTTENSVYYNGKQNFTFSNGKILFNVYTSKIRIIDCLMTNRRNNISITINNY